MDACRVFKKETVGSSDLDPPGSRSVTIRCGIVAEMTNYFWLRLVTRTSITRNARRSLVHPPSQQTRHSPKRELIVTGVFKRRNLGSRRMRATFMAQERRTVKASAVRNRPASDVTDRS